VASRWAAEIVPALKPLVRAIFSVPRLLGVRDGMVTLGAPNDAHRAKCDQHRPEVEKVAAGIVGSPVRVQVVTDTSVRNDDIHDPHHEETTSSSSRQPGGRADGGVPPSVGARMGGAGTVVALHPGGAPVPDDDIDLHDLVDAPPESVVSPIDRLAQAFPGSELMDERH